MPRSWECSEGAPIARPEQPISPNVFSVGGLPRDAKGHPVQFTEVRENVFLDRSASAGKTPRGAGTR